jgi:hypothetical protein
MTIPSGPITIEITTADPETVQIIQGQPPVIEITNAGPQGPTGQTGPAGSTGSQGVAGTPGSKWYQGSGSPSGATGIVGDFYIDTSSSNVYEKTGSSVWTLRLNIKGDTGNTGSAGAAGSRWYQGTSAPSSGLGITGDFYINTTTYDVSEKTDSTTWTVRLNIKGATGAAGTNGTNGSAGPANTLTIGTVSTGAAGSSASASVTGTSPNQTLNLTIPRGDTGATGTNNTTIVRKTADEQVVSSVTVQDDDHLVIALAANSVYAFDSFIMFDSDPAADIKFTFAGPTGSTISFTSDGVSAGNSNNIGSIKMDVNAAAVETVLGGFVGTKTAIRPAGVIVTGSTAGNLTFRWSQNVTSTTATTVYTNSWLRAQKA